MWRKRTRPAPEDLVIPDDIGEAVAAREETHEQLAALRKQAPFIRMMTDAMIDRSGKNHYMETLYQHVPRGAS